MEETMLEKAEFASEHIKGITAWSKKIKNSHNQHFIEVLEAKGKTPNLFSLISWESAALVEKIISLLPGMKSPTVVALATPGWSSVHSVIDESDFWEIIEQLKLAGAEGILVVPIEKMIL